MGTRTIESALFCWTPLASVQPEVTGKDDGACHGQFVAGEGGDHVLGVQVGPQLWHRQELLVTDRARGGEGSAVEHQGGVGGCEVGGEGGGGQH